MSFIEQSILHSCAPGPGAHDGAGRPPPIAGGGFNNTNRRTFVDEEIDKGKKSCGPGAHNLPDSSVDKYSSTSGQRFGGASKDPYKVRQYLSKHHMKVFLTTESPGPKYNRYDRDGQGGGDSSLLTAAPGVGPFGKSASGCYHIEEAIKASCTPGPGMVEGKWGDAPSASFKGEGLRIPRLLEETRQMADFFIPGANTYDVRGAPTSLPSFTVKEKRFKAGQSKEKRRVKGFVASLLGPDTTLHGDTMHVSGKSPPAVRREVERGALEIILYPGIHPLYTFSLPYITLYTRSLYPL